MSAAETMLDRVASLLSGMGQADQLDQLDRIAEAVHAVAAAGGLGVVAGLQIACWLLGDGVRPESIDAGRITAWPN